MPTTPQPLSTERPLSLVLGAGGVRGLAHVGVLEAVLSRGFRVTEIVGTSVGALIAAFYASVGMDVATLRSVGLDLTTRHLLAWAWLRRAPDPVFRRFRHRAGPIPDSVDRLARADWAHLYNGIERIGLVAYDLEREEVVVGHNEQSLITVEDAARGAAALPGLFPARRCDAGARTMRLCDGGVVNRLPVDVLFAEPFRPEQVLAVDISNTPRIREQNLGTVFETRDAHPDVPIALAMPETLGGPTILFRRSRVAALIDLGRRAAEAALDRATAARQSAG